MGLRDYNKEKPDLSSSLEIIKYEKDNQSEGTK